MSLKIGLGFDVHALVEGRPLILGGVDIPFEKGLLGHSDADVLAHAISDAILGALREGDIGKLFPDTDPAFKNADSLQLLARVADLMRTKGYELIDCDTVVACEMPKLSPYREEMRRNLAQALQVPVEKLGIKATTTEELGFAGRGEGIQAHAVVLLAHKTGTVYQA